jgi:tetratricopeptide (TPR) repeat protein
MTRRHEMILWCLLSLAACGLEAVQPWDDTDDEMMVIYVRAAQALQQRDCGTAVALYEQTIARKPDDDEIPISRPRRWAQNNLAWTLATCPDDGVRDGRRALALASRLNAKAPHSVPYVGTLAAAYAEVGRFPDAIRTQQEALALLPLSHPEYDRFTRMLNEYRAGRPWRDDTGESIPMEP